MPRSVIAGVDVGSITLPSADRLIDVLVSAARGAGVDPGGLVVGTHLQVTRSGRPHVVLTTSSAGTAGWQWWLMVRALSGHRAPLAVCVGRDAVGDDDAVEAARAAVEERAGRIAGRCVHFPGAEAIAGTMTAGQITAASAIDVVTEVGRGELAPDAEILTGARVRPRWEFGALTLHVQHEGQGVYLPFESASALRVG